MPFSIGIVDFWDKHVDMYHDLGVTHCKVPIGYPAPTEHVLEVITPMLDAGIEPVLDIRTDGDFVAAGIAHRCENEKCGLDFRLAGGRDKCPRCGLAIEPKTDEELKEIVRDHDNKFCAWALDVMQATFPKCRQFEIWGEPQCPILTRGGALNPARLVLWLAAIKKCSQNVEGVQILNGGLGIGPWKDVEFFQMAKVGTLNWIDVVNLHPFTFQEDPEVQAKMIDWMMAMVRYQCRKWKRPGLPIAVSEWGYPSAIPAHEGMLLASGVLPTGIEAISEERHAALIDASMRVFYRYDVGPVCMMTRDVEGPPVAECHDFWAFHCGVLRSDYSKKPAYETFKKWGAIAKRG